MKEDELKELLHWLAYNFPDVYKIWTDNKNQEQSINMIRKNLNKRLK